MFHSFFLPLSVMTMYFLCLNIKQRLCQLNKRITDWQAAFFVNFYHFRRFLSCIYCILFLIFALLAIIFPFHCRLVASLHLSRYIATDNSDIKITIFSGFSLHFRNIATKKRNRQWSTFPQNQFLYLFLQKTLTHFYAIMHISGSEFFPGAQRLCQLFYIEA